MTTTQTLPTTLAKKVSHAFNKDIYLLGIGEDGSKYWLEAPTWDCDWYWGFGYVETYTNNENPAISKDISSHQHISSSFMGECEYYDSKKQCFRKGEYVNNIYDSKLLSSKTFTKDEGWELSELFTQFYFLQKAAENFGRGKCHISDTKAPKWESKELAKQINEVHIPAVTARILEILTPTK